jgi:hypothetical protein
VNIIERHFSDTNKTIHLFFKQCKKTLLKGILLFVLIFSMTTQTADAQAPKEVRDKVSNIIISIRHTDWNMAYKQTVDLRGYYNKNRWKLQLMGDEQEYEGLSSDIENLKAALIAKDKAEALIFIYDIKEIFNQIFQL